MNVGGLHVLRPYGVKRIVDPKRLAESIGYSKRGSSRACGRSRGVAVDRQREWRTRCQALVERVTLEKAGGSVAAADDEFVHCLIGKADAGHDLLVVGVVTGAIGAHNDA